MVLAASFSSCNNQRHNKQGDGRSDHVCQRISVLPSLRAARAAAALSLSYLASNVLAAHRGRFAFVKDARTAIHHHLHVPFNVIFVHNDQRTSINCTEIIIAPFAVSPFLDGIRQPSAQPLPQELAVPTMVAYLPWSDTRNDFNKEHHQLPHYRSQFYITTPKDCLRSTNLMTKKQSRVRIKKG